MSAILLASCAPMHTETELERAVYLDSTREIAYWLALSVKLSVGLWMAAQAVIIIVLVAVMVKGAPWILSLITARLTADLMTARYKAREAHYRFTLLFNRGELNSVSEAELESRRLVLALLEDARRATGDDSVSIPRWDKLDGHPATLHKWTGERWQNAIDSIREYLLIRQGGGGYTTLQPGFANLATFERLVRAGEIRLSPPPLRDDPEGE